jgi:hypothetical protein
MPTDSQLEVLFRTWWQQSYPTPPGTHALMTHIAFGRFLLTEVAKEILRQTPEQPR